MLAEWYINVTDHGELIGPWWTTRTIYIHGRIWKSAERIYLNHMATKYFLP
jgi:hypothetical protein